MISGWFDCMGNPVVGAYLDIPGVDLKDNGFVPFLLDTGADRTALHPSDARRLGISFDTLPEPEALLGGISGAGGYSIVSVRLSFNGGEPALATAPSGRLSPSATYSGAH